MVARKMYGGSRKNNFEKLKFKVLKVVMV